MSNPIIYTDSIQSYSSSSDINLYTNKNNGNINIGNTKVLVSIPSLSVNNLTLINNDNLTLNTLTVNNITYKQPTTSYYFNFTNSSITTNKPANQTLNNVWTPESSFDPGAGNSLIKSFSISASILNNLYNAIIELTLFSSVTPDINSCLQYYFTITDSTLQTLYYTSYKSDDINDLSSNPDIPTGYILRKDVNFLSGFQSKETLTYFFNIYCTVTKYIASSPLRKLNTFYSGHSTLGPNSISNITIYNSYNAGYNTIMTNNYLFSAASTIQNTLSCTGSTEISFGIPILLTKGIWNITMCTTINVPTYDTNRLNTRFNHFMLYYKSNITNDIIPDSYSYNYISNDSTSNILEQTISNNNILVITQDVCIIYPFIKLLSPYTSNTITFKNLNTITNSISGYYINRIK
jgi:hypothetical protein